MRDMKQYRVELLGRAVLNIKAPSMAEATIRAGKINEFILITEIYVKENNGKGTPRDE